MSFSRSPATLQNWSGSVLAVGIAANDPQGLIGQLEARLNSPLGSWLETQRFQAKAGEVVSLQLLHKDLSRLVLVGLGDATTADESTADVATVATLRQAAAALAKACIGLDGRAGVHLPWGSDGTRAAEAVAEAIRLSLYRDTRFRSQPDPRLQPEHFDLLGDLPADLSDAMERVDAHCAGVELARELVAAPPNSVTPAALGDTAAAIALAAHRLPEDAVMLVCPSDHHIADAAAFRDAAVTGAALAAEGWLVAFGITATAPAPTWSAACATWVWSVRSLP